MKTIFTVGLGIAIILAVAAGILMILPSLASPPVDISEINIQGNVSTADLLPGELAYFSLDEEQLQTGYAVAETDPPFYVEQTFAPYGGTLLAFALRPDYEEFAPVILDIFYEENYGSVAGSRTRTETWFTVDAEGLSVFFWRSGRYVFGIEAGSSNMRQQASKDFTQYLRNISS